MSDYAKEIISITVEEELKRSYLDYAMSVIIGRALPDVRDGLKPVHRRTLFAMNQLGNDWNKPYKKSARIVGDVIGKYHPHGDTAVYDTIVRMAQSFSMRYMLVDGQGNFGSVDGDAPAAMRYTEIRMARIAHSLIADLDKETVDFVPNYDETEQIPVVFPTRIPNLLVNGSSGIAVGMATNIPPHNLNEVIDATLALIDNSELTIAELMKYIPGPDFPTAAIINGRAGIVEAYQTGRGRIHIRAKTEIETDAKGKASIIVHELPYQVNKALLLEKIGELVREKRIEGITELRDESDKDGMRMVIEIRRGDQPEVILNNLYAHTQLQNVFGINIVALDKGQPRQMNLKQLLEAFIQHRRDVVIRRAIYELRKARERAHILEGLSVALANIDEVIVLIKAAKTPADAKISLIGKSWKLHEVADWLQKIDMEKVRPETLEKQYGLHDADYFLSPEQAQAILDLRLHRLTNLEQNKIHTEYQNLIAEVAQLTEIISNPVRLHEVIRQELLEVKEQFGDTRRTEIIDATADLCMEDLITEEDVVVTLSRDGYIKYQTLDSYQAQHRGGRGRMATTVKEEDVIKNILVAGTHDTILFFSNKGKVYWLKVYNIPQGSRQARGKPIVNLLPLDAEEVITAILPLCEIDSQKYVFMATAKGVVKKVELSEFAVPRSNGKVALDLNPGDHLIGVAITDGNQDLMMMADSGKAIRFNESMVRPMGRSARGVRGIRLREAQSVIALIVLQPGASILTATENGFGQRTYVDDYRAIGRGGQGVGVIRVNARNGKVVAATQVFDDDDVLLISDQGTMVRTRVNEVSVLGRNTQGVRLIQLGQGEKLVGIEAVRITIKDEIIKDEVDVDVDAG